MANAHHPEVKNPESFFKRLAHRLGYPCHADEAKVCTQRVRASAAQGVPACWVKMICTKHQILEGVQPLAQRLFAHPAAREGDARRSALDSNRRPALVQMARICMCRTERV